MVFKRKSFSSTAEIIELIKTDDEIMHSTSVLYFHRQDKVSGKIYMLQGEDPGLIYAVHASNIPFHIGKRLKPYIDPDDYEDMMRQVSWNTTDPAIARIAVSKQLVPQRIINTFILEYLFDAFAEIMSWENVAMERKANIITKDFASGHYISLPILEEKVKHRQEKYEAQIKDTRLPEEQLDRLRLLRHPDIDINSIGNKNLEVIMGIADGRNTLASLREETGMFRKPALSGVHTLWKHEHIKLLAGDVPIYPPVNKPVEEEDQSKKPNAPLDFEPPHEDTNKEPETVETTPEPSEGTIQVEDLPQPEPVIVEEESEPVEPEPVYEEPEAEPETETIPEKTPFVNVSILDKLNQRLQMLTVDANEATKNASMNRQKLNEALYQLDELRSQIATLEENTHVLQNRQDDLDKEEQTAQDKLDKMIDSIDTLTN